MANANDIYMERQVEAAKAEAEREAMRQRMRREWDEWTPRARRAHHHGNMVLAVFSKFIPEACRPEAFEEAMLNFFSEDYEIVPVPPERDAQHALALRRALISSAPKLIFPKDGSI